VADFATAGSSYQRGELGLNEYFSSSNHMTTRRTPALILTRRLGKGRISPLQQMRGELAQWLEQRNHNPLVPSSNLGFATKEPRSKVLNRVSIHPIDIISLLYRFR
jgi:hypothetical protein